MKFFNTFKVGKACHIFKSAELLLHPSSLDAILVPFHLPSYLLNRLLSYLQLANNTGLSPFNLALPRINIALPVFALKQNDLLSELYTALMHLLLHLNLQWVQTISTVLEKQRQSLELVFNLSEIQKKERGVLGVRAE